MINKDLYNYKNDKIDSTHQVFGVVLKPNSELALNEICNKLHTAQFAQKIKKCGADDDINIEHLIIAVINDEYENQEDTSEESFNKMICIYMNEALNLLLSNLDCPKVTFSGV